MDDEEIRLECLKMAQGDTAKAEEMFQFIKRRGKFNGLVGGFDAPKLENEHVRVVGKDGDLGPFTDYVKSK